MAGKELHKETGIMLVISFVLLFMVNSFVLLAANAMFPKYVVLGTQYISFWWAIIHSMGLLTLINVFAIPIVHEYENSRGRMFSDKEWMLSYLVINFVGVWGITRFADDLGFGISSFIVAIVLALVLDALQGIAMMQMEKMRKK